MQKKTGSGELITWYLARLRNNARQTSLDRKLTPLSLVETDKTLIQEIVMNSHVGHEQRSADILKNLRQDNRFIRQAQTVLLVLAVVGTFFLLAVLLI
jgi:hypothetical protein